MTTSTQPPEQPPQSTPTPRTDSNTIWGHACVGGNIYTTVEFARTLERELEDAKELNEKLMLLSKMTEHILDDEPGWQAAVTEFCPTIQSAIALRQQLTAAQEANTQANKAIGDIANECKGYADQLTAMTAERDETIAQAKIDIAEIRRQHQQEWNEHKSDEDLIKERDEAMEKVKELNATFEHVKGFNKIVSRYEQGEKNFPWVTVREELAELCQVIDAAISKGTKEPAR